MSETPTAVESRTSGGNGNGNGHGARRGRRSRQDELEQIQDELSRPLAPEAVEFMVQRTVGGAKNDPTHAIVVPYLQRVAVEERLDEEVHPDEWEATYPREDQHGVLCRLVVLGVVRESYGQGSNRWSQEANAFKRAARQFGLGRYLVKMRPMKIPIGTGPLQVHRAGPKSYDLPDTLVDRLRQGYRERVEASYVQIYGAIVEVSGFDLGSHDEGEQASGAEVEEAGQPAEAPTAQTGAGGVPTLVAESSGPGADKGSSGAPPAAIAAVKQATRDAGLILSITRDLSRLLIGKATIDRLSGEEAASLTEGLGQIAQAKLARADVINAVSRAIKAEGEREEKAERFRKWVADRAQKAEGEQPSEAKGEQTAEGAEQAAEAGNGGEDAAADEGVAS